MAEQRVRCEEHVVAEATVDAVFAGQRDDGAVVVVTGRAIDFARTVPARERWSARATFLLLSSHTWLRVVVDPTVYPRCALTLADVPLAPDGTTVPLGARVDAWSCALGLLPEVTVTGVVCWPADEPPVLIASDVSVAAPTRSGEEGQ